VWRVKLVTELQAGETTEVEVARLERDEQAGLADLGLGLAEAKRLTAAIQAEIVPAQVTIASDNRRTCLACGRVLASTGHYTHPFQGLCYSLFAQTDWTRTCIEAVCLGWTQDFFERAQRWRDAGCVDETFEAHCQWQNL
jgi:hypothetical protein